LNAARTLKLVSLALATALLAGGAWLVQGALKQLAFERADAAQLQQRLENARRLIPEVEQRERLVRSLDNVQAQVSRMGFDPARWGERRLRRPGGPATRVEASQFLSDLERSGAGAIFVADEFDLAAASPDAGLFQPPGLDDKGLTLAANGTLYFQTADVAAPLQRKLP
jgi:hypothetical protein